MNYFWIAFGGALGSVLRFASSEWFQSRWPSFPWGTLFVNALGSLLIGMLAAMSEAGRLSDSFYLRTFLMIGVLGGFTTFSSFSVQTLLLARSGAVLMAGFNVLASISLCLCAAWLGFVLGSQFIK